MNTDGTNFNVIHDFAGGADDGEGPYDNPVLYSGKLYGMTRSGGDNDLGVIYSIDPDGNNYTNLYEFSSSSGSNPSQALVISSDKMYGMTGAGGDNSKGVIFSVNINGTGYSKMHDFAGGANDGSEPHGSLALSGSTLYGLTTNGGDSDLGVTFSIGTNGTGFTILHEFSGADGKNPWMTPIIHNNVLFGTAPGNGTDNHGVLYRMNPNGSDFQVLREFDANVDGSNLFGGITAVGETIYGNTYTGGAPVTFGVVYSINTGGGSFTILHAFEGGPGDAQDQSGGLTYSDGYLYGMSNSGGSLFVGTIYRVVAVPEPSTYAFFVIGLAGLIGGCLKKRNK